jgi:multiple sugar transport system substrate-binding protein
LRIGLQDAILPYVALCFLAGCGGSPPSLVVAVNAGVEGDALKAAAREFGLAQSLKVEIVDLPYANLFEKELLDLSSRTGAYDVIMMDDPWFPRLSQGGALTPMPSQSPDADFLASCLDVCRQSNVLYALPYVGNSQLFFYRKDLFSKYSLAAPATWSDVLAAAKKIGAGEKMYGYVMRAAPGNPVVADFLPVLWAFGGEMFSADGTPAVDSPPGIEALRFMLELGKHSPPGYAGFNADEVSAHLLQSTAAMSINWPAWIAAMDDPAKSKVVGKIEFTTVPSEKLKGRAGLGTWLLGVPAASKNKDRAFEFIAWATGAKPMKQAALRGNPPTRRSVFLDPELRAKYRSLPAQLQSLETARPRPRSPRWNEIENAFGIYLSQANAGTVSPDEAMRRAAKDIAAIVAR